VVTGFLLGAFIEDQHRATLEFRMAFDILSDRRE
jgi:hypothetical protein